MIEFKNVTTEYLDDAVTLMTSDELIQGQLTDSDIRYFAAYKGDVPIGYMGVEPAELPKRFFHTSAKPTAWKDISFWARIVKP